MNRGVYNCLSLAERTGFESPKAYSVGTLSEAPAQRMVVQWAMFPKLPRLWVGRLSNLIKSCVKAKSRIQVRIRRSIPTFQLQVAGYMTPQATAWIATLEVRDKLC